MKSRLQKIIADSGLCSRRKAEIMIDDRRVKVNGKVANLGDSADPENDIILVNGKALTKQPKIYILLNKPPGYECTMDSTTGKPLAIDLVGIKSRIFSVGRLDLNSRGLLLLTNDGEFANKIIHPTGSVEKEYHVKVANSVPDDIIEVLRTGVWLEGVKTRPCQVEVLERGKHATMLKFILHEGRKRQVRRMLEIYGFKAIDLKRERIGNLILAGLKEGRWRNLTTVEVKALLEFKGQELE
ncbi:MAG: pseudouridine synthase [Thermoplasmata archaeon]|nr:pseudouridine synthase [Thermoplasmata archaeon]